MSAPDDPWAIHPDLPLTTEAVITRLAQLIGGLGDRHRALTVRVDALETPATAGGHHARLRLERLEPKAAATTHQQLAQWVRWLVATYQLGDIIPPCWDRHDPIAEELAGFYVAWQAVWTDHGRYDAAIAWHEQLYRARERLTSWVRGTTCTTTCGLDTTLLENTQYRWDTTRGAGHHRYRLHQTHTHNPAPLPPAPRPHAADD